MKNFKSLLFLAASIFSFSAFSGNIVPEKIAQEVINIRLSMAEPKTDFDTWQADQWLHYASTCAYHAGIRLPEALVRAGFYKNGSWTLPNDTAMTCLALTQGPKPMCYELKSTQFPFGTIRADGLPSNYAYLEVPLDESKNVYVAGYCHLVENQPLTRQFYVGPGYAKWLQKPLIKKINTANGGIMVNSGTIEFISSAPGRHIATAVVR